jgi:hypothetical protein
MLGCAGPCASSRLASDSSFPSLRRRRNLRIDAASPPFRARRCGAGGPERFGERKCAASARSKMLNPGESLSYHSEGLVLPAAVTMSV